MGLLTRSAPDAGFLAYTLEDAVRAVKIPGRTAIPAGTYELALRTEGGMHNDYSQPGHWASDIHKGMLWLPTVPNFEWVYIHAGNIHQDTKGCPLVGDSASQNVTEDGTVGASRAAYRRIYPPIASALMARERVVLTITNGGHG